jgi:EpsI family protein
LLVVGAGIAYRAVASRLKSFVDTPIELPVPLSAFPKQIGQWTGEDVPIPPNILRATGNDDSLNRLYRNTASHEWADLYIAYTGRPRVMLGHRPEVCYVAGGWVHDRTEESAFTASSGKRVPCMVYNFHMPRPQYQERVVLNFYIVNGRLTADESAFSGVGWRTPNIAGDPARYVAQVQVGSVLESSVRTVVEDLADLILDFFPDENGEVAVVRAGQSPGGTQGRALPARE